MNLNKIFVAIGICRACVIGLEIPEPIQFIEIDIQYAIQFKNPINDTSTNSQKIQTTKSDTNEIKEPIKKSPMEWRELQEMAMKLDVKNPTAIILQFANRVIQSGHADDTLMSDIILLIANKPFDNWSDSDVERFPELVKAIGDTILRKMSHEDVWPLRKKPWSQIKTTPDNNWSQIYSFSGNGQMNSGIFYLTGNNPKRIRYTYRAPKIPGEFQIGAFYVFIVEASKDIMVDGGFPEIMTTRSFESSQSSIYKKSGAYHLTILSSGDWTVTIEEEIKK